MAERLPGRYKGWLRRPVTHPHGQRAAPARKTWSESAGNSRIGDLHGGMSPTLVFNISFSWPPPEGAPGQPVGRLAQDGELQLCLQILLQSWGPGWAVRGLTPLSGVESRLCMGRHASLLTSHPKDQAKPANLVL